MAAGSSKQMSKGQLLSELQAMRNRMAEEQIRRREAEAEKVSDVQQKGRAGSGVQVFVGAAEELCMLRSVACRVRRHPEWAWAGQTISNGWQI
jgi:hypothetical protein